MLVLFHKIVREQFKLGALTDVYYNLQNVEFVISQNHFIYISNSYETEYRFIIKL